MLAQVLEEAGHLAQSVSASLSAMNPLSGLSSEVNHLRCCHTTDCDLCTVDRLLD